MIYKKYEFGETGGEVWGGRGGEAGFQLMRSAKG